MDFGVTFEVFWDDVGGMGTCLVKLALFFSYRVHWVCQLSGL